MKYLIIGAGGTGGPLGAFMTKAGKDVTLIARGAHLKAMQEKGLRIQRPACDEVISPIKASDMDHYDDQPDVIFVCVKGYSLADTIPFIKRVSKADTVVIPILNIYGTGGQMQKELPDILVTDGCIYIASEIREPGWLWMNANLIRVIFGVRKPEEDRPVLKEIEKDLIESGIDGRYSDNIARDALQKFSFVSPMAGYGFYYDAKAGEAQKPGQIRDDFIAMMKEIDALAGAMGICFEEDIVAVNLKIMDALSPEATASMQRDVKAGRPSEIDGLIYEVVRLGHRLNVPVPTYERIAEEGHRRGLK